MVKEQQSRSVRLGSRPSTIYSFKSGLQTTTKACPYAASWFTVPNAIIKVLLSCFSVILLSLMLSWESEGVRIFDLTDSVNDINYRNPIYCYLAVAILTIIFAIVMTILGGGGFDIPPLLQALVIGSFLFLWLVSSAIISASLDTIGHTKYARDRNLNLMYLTVANVFGFLIVACFTFDILLAFVALREIGEKAEELKESKRVLNSALKHVTGRGSYRRRLSSSKLKDPTPVIMKEGTPIAHL